MHWLNWLKLTGIFFIPAVLYTGASFFHLRYPHWSLGLAIFVSILFAIVEYIFRVPAIKVAHNDMGASTLEIQVIWIILTLAMAYSMKFMIPEPTKKSSNQV